MASAHWKIIGRVQGVGMRGWLAYQARALKLGGGARNEEDGSVRAHFTGSAQAIEQMRKKLLSLHEKWGPDVQKVEEVANQPAPDEKMAENSSAPFVILD